MIGLKTRIIHWYKTFIVKFKKRDRQTSFVNQNQELIYFPKLRTALVVDEKPLCYWPQKWTNTVQLVWMRTPQKTAS